MMDKWTLISNGRTLSEERELKTIFGEDAVISRVGRFNLIHLDRPSAAEIAHRVAQFDPEDYFDDDCPLCRMMLEEGGDIVYDDFSGASADPAGPETQ